MIFWLETSVKYSKSSLKIRIFWKKSRFFRLETSVKNSKASLKIRRFWKKSRFLNTFYSIYIFLLGVLGILGAFEHFRAFRKYLCVFWYLIMMYSLVRSIRKLGVFWAFQSICDFSIFGLDFEKTLLFLVQCPLESSTTHWVTLLYYRLFKIMFSQVCKILAKLNIFLMN